MDTRLANYRTKVIIGRKLEGILTGRVSLNNRLRGIWGFGESDMGLFFYAGAHHSPEPIICESREIAIRFSNLLSHFFAQRENSRWILDFDEEHNGLVSNETTLVPNRPAAGQRGQRALPKEVGESFDFHLVDHFTFSIWNPAGLLSLDHLSIFLSESLEHFKYQRENWRANCKYGCPSFCKPFALGSKPIGWMGTWFCPNSPFNFDIDDLCFRVAKLLSIATSIGDLAKLLRTNPEATTGSGLESVFEALTYDDTGLNAFRILFDRTWDR